MKFVYSFSISDHIKCEEVVGGTVDNKGGKTRKVLILGCITSVRIISN